jgi:hypothetical protein
LRRFYAVGGTGALLLGLALVFQACNLFSPFASSDTSSLDYRGLLLKGDAAINRGDYEKAEEYFAAAKHKRPQSAEAYLKHAKAIVSLYGLDFTTFNAEFDSKRGESARGIPYIDSLSTVTSVNQVYHPVAVAVSDLEHILRLKEDSLVLNDRFSLPPDGDTASDGSVTSGVARLDLGILQAVKAMLAPLDMDRNLSLDSACGAAICPEFSSDCLQSDPYLKLCREGPLSEVKRLNSFIKLTKGINLDNLDSKDIQARDVSTNPNDINAFIESMEGSIAGSSYNLDSVSTVLNDHGEENISKELDGVVTNVKDLGRFLGFMRYNDGLDNDFDAQKKPGTSMSITVWHDFDKDGGIRYDYDDTARFQGYPPGGYNLGHPLHRHLRSELYLTIEDLGKTFPNLTADTSENTRIGLMRKNCRDHVPGLDGNYPEYTSSIRNEILEETCRDITSLLREEVMPPERSDWLGGTYGVDEEMIDERDNDQDGLKDEDARNARGMDDDDDGALTLDMIGTVPEPMRWEDDDEHANGCPDIDVTQPMPDSPYEKQFCIGSIEHRLHVAREAPDSLRLYYSRFPTEGASVNCLDDYEKLSEDFRNDFAPTRQELNQACLYKHIWIAPRPENSEWVSGVFGIDEEKADGIDNDGDGWIDEDNDAP